MNEYNLFLQELNAITNYANSSNTTSTEQTVRNMLTSLLTMKIYDLYGDRTHCIEGVEVEKAENKKITKKY